MWSSDFKLIPTSYWIKLCFLIFLYYQIQKRIQKINGKGEKDKTLFFFFKAAQGLELEREKEKGEMEEETSNDLTIPQYKLQSHALVLCYQPLDQITEKVINGQKEE